MNPSRLRFWCARRVTAVVMMAGLGVTAAPALAVTGYSPSMVLSVTTTADTPENTPCPTTTSGGVLVNSGACSLRGAIDRANQYLYSFNEPATNTTGDTNGACPTEIGGVAPSAVPLVRINMKSGTYLLTNGELHVNGFCDSGTWASRAGYVLGRVEIVGPGPAQATVDGSGNAPLHPGAVFSTEVPVQMSGLAVTGGQGAYNENCHSNYCGGGINFESGFTLTNAVVTKNTVIGSRAGSGGGIHANAYNANFMANVQITNNVASFEGGGLLFDAETLTMNNVTISGNQVCNVFSHPAATPWTAGNVCVDTSTEYGGGIWNSSIIKMIGGAVTGNTAGSLATGYGSGGGIFNRWDFEPQGVKVSSNVAGNSGGGIQNEYILNASGGSFTNNRAGSIAGGVSDASCEHRGPGDNNGCSGNGAGTSLNGTSVSGNTAGGTFDCKLTGPSFTSCTQDLGGSKGIASTSCPGVLATGEHCFSIDGIAGGIYLNYEVNFTGGGLTNNTAVSVHPAATSCTSEGGGIWTNDDPLTMRSSKILSNVASCGAGDYLSSAAGSSLYHSFVLDNQAGLFGGAFYIDPGGASPPATQQLLLDGSQVVNNYAGTQTGGIHNFGFSNFLLQNGAAVAGNHGGSCPNVTIPCS